MGWVDFDFTEPPIVSGYASTLPAEGESDADARVRRLRESVVEITGRELEVAPATPMGFLS